jgi:signal transduction histidine kinase
LVNGRALAAEEHLLTSITSAVSVLLIEDDLSYQRLIRAYLQEHGATYQLKIAASIAEGLAHVAADRFDVALLDLGLPDAEGIDVVEQLRAAAPQLPIVVLSGRADVDTALESMRRGVQEYLVKGQAEDLLLPRAIRYAIERKRSQDMEQLLVGIVSHDLRNPLNTILLAQQLLSRSPNISAEERRNLDRIVNAGARATRLVRDLMDVTRLRMSGTLPMSCVNADLNEAARRVVDELSGDHPQRSILLELASGEARAWADPTRIEQAIGNLVANALQHGKQDSPILVKLSRDQDCVTVAVRNEGEPIPSEIVPRLFEPLVRVSRSGSAHSGIGLGLFICSHIVKAHAGSIEVSSTAESGTEFLFRIPRSPASELC